MSDVSLGAVAVHLRITSCPHGCVIVVVGDAEARPIAHIHIDADGLEAVIAGLRAARDELAARARPLA